MSKKTHEEYVAELAEKNPDIEVIGRYVNAKTNIEHHCLIHDVYWDARPDNILHGRGCPECANEKRAKSQTMSRDEYINRLADKNPTVELVGEYINARTKTLHHCLIHDVYWDTTPDRALNKMSGCPECAKEKSYIARAKTRDEYIRELNDKNPNLELVGEYKGCKVPTCHRCKIHNVLFDTMPSTALRGCGCNLCMRDKLRECHLRSEEDYIKELADKNPLVKLIGKYIDSLTPTEHICLRHNVVWKPTPARVLGGGGCIQCSSEKISEHLKKSKDEYIQELAEANPDVILVGEYNGSKIPTEHYCKEHDESFFISPASALKGCGCTHCRGSKGEKYIAKWLSEHSIEYVSQKSFEECRDKNPLPFDFYLPDYNCCIEYDGKQHYEPVEYFGGEEYLAYTQMHDAVKNQYCADNNIKLLRIPYFANVEEELNNFLFI